jgi:RNA polymerase sigma factor (sigma-70 family)
MAEFQTTCWTLIMAATEGTPETRHEALGRLCRAYWMPVFAYIRRRGQPEEEARDLTQGFFARLLEKHWLDLADQERGKFRGFLLTMLKRYLADQHDYETRQKRSGGHTHFSIDWAEAPEIPDRAETPDQAYDRRWALTVLHRATGRLRAEAEVSGRLPLFVALAPFIGSEPPPGRYEQVGNEVGLSRAAVAMAVSRLRLRLRELARSEVAETLTDRQAVETELQELMTALRG